MQAEYAVFIRITECLGLPQYVSTLGIAGIQVDITMGFIMNRCGWLDGYITEILQLFVIERLFCFRIFCKCKMVFIAKMESI